AGALAPDRLLVITAPFKLLFLVLATLLGRGAAVAFGCGNPAGPGWLLTALALPAYTVSQLLLTWYQVVVRTQSHSPASPVPLFVAGMLLLVAALLRFLLVYTGDAMPLGSRREAWTLCVAGAVPLAALCWWLLRTVLAEEAPLAEHVLNV